MANQRNRMDRSGKLGRLFAAQLAEITLEKVSEAGFANARANAALISKGRSIAALQETSLIEGTVALVIAAGPSLHRKQAARIINTSGFKGTIVATESATHWCLRHGIVPDLIVTLDSHPHRIVRWFGYPDLKAEDIIRDDYFARQDMDPGFREDQLRTNQELVDIINKKGSSMRIAIASSTSGAVARRVIESGMEAYWWNPMYDDYDEAESMTRRIHELNGLPCVNAGGNVGTACWVLAHAVLRKRRIGLVGMDFSYYAETPYFHTQYYKEIVNLVGLDRVDEVFVRIRNPYLDEEFYTDPAYLWYRDSFIEMAQDAGCDTYNCTEGGILFDPPIKWATLGEFLSMPDA